MRSPVAHPFAATPLRPGPALVAFGTAAAALLATVGIMLLVCAQVAP